LLVLPKSLDEQFAGLEKLIAGRRGLQLGSFLLFVDFYLTLRFRVNLLVLDWDWAKSHIGLGGTATIVFFFFLFATFLMPWVHEFLLLPSLIGSEIMIHKREKTKGGYVRGIESAKLLEFAIIQGNSIAYQEYLRKENASDEYLKNIRWQFVFICALGLDTFAAKSDSETLLEVFWSSLRSLPVWIFYPSVAALAVSLLFLLWSSLFFGRFAGKYYLTGPRLYQFIKASIVPDEEEPTD